MVAEHLKIRSIKESFKHNPYGPIFLLGGIFYGTVNKLSEHQFENFFLEKLTLVSPLFMVAASVIAWKRTAVAYYRTIKLFDRTKAENWGKLVGRLEYKLGKDINGCRSIGIYLAIEDIKKNLLKK